MKITKKNTKAIAALTALTAILGLSLSACGSSANGATQDDKVIKVAASPTPHSDILNKVVKPILQKQGYKLVVKEFTDYVQPNTAVEEGEVDANYHQHLPYLNNFNKERGTHIISIAGIHFEPFGLYPGKTKSIKDLKDGATVAIPSDPTNEARALLLLQDAGLLKLKNPKDVNSTKKDIVSNPKNLKFKELDASLVPTVVKDVDLAALNGNYAIQAGFNPTRDPLTSEKVGGVAAKTYENIIAVKKGSEKLAKIKALVKALKTSKVRDFIKKNYNGAVLPVF